MENHILFKEWIDLYRLETGFSKGRTAESNLPFLLSKLLILGQVQVYNLNLIINKQYKSLGQVQVCNPNQIVNQ